MWIVPIRPSIPSAAKHHGWHGMLLSRKHEPALKVRSGEQLAWAYERVGGWVPGNEQRFPRLAIVPRSLRGPIGTWEGREALAAVAVSLPFHGCATRVRVGNS